MGEGFEPEGPQNASGIVEKLSMKCKHCGGSIVLDPGDCLNPKRLVCLACGRELKLGTEDISNQLDHEREEKVKALLKTHSVREITKETGVAKNTIARIRNENLTEAERATLKRSANIKGRNKRELKKKESRPDLQNDGRNIPKIIPSTNSDGKGGQKIMTEETKVCTNPKCPKPNPQPIGEFNKNVARPTGRESRCRTCTAQAQRDRKIATEKASSGGRRHKKQRRPRPSTVQNPVPNSLSSPDPQAIKSAISAAVTFDAQLLKVVKKSAILDFVKNDLPRMIEEAFP
jgi:hypothetical protein